MFSTHFWSFNFMTRASVSLSRHMYLVLSCWIISSSVMFFSQKIWAAAARPDRQRAALHGMRARDHSTFTVRETLLSLDRREGLEWLPRSEILKKMPLLSCLFLSGPLNENCLHSPLTGHMEQAQLIGWNDHRYHWGTANTVWGKRSNMKNFLHIKQDPSHLTWALKVFLYVRYVCEVFCQVVGEKKKF